MHNHAAAFLDLLNQFSQKHPEAVLALLTYISVAGSGLLLIVRGFERMRKTPALENFWGYVRGIWTSQSQKKDGHVVPV